MVKSIDISINKLEEQIIRHKLLYYKGIPEISDDEYDHLENILRDRDPANLALGMVGSIVSSEEKIKHDEKMLSLNKTYDIDDLIKWADGRELISLYKIDGVSCSLVYEEGRLILGKTRGDGIYGENITAKVLWMESIPKVILGEMNGEDLTSFEIRGELYIRERSFFELSLEMEKKGLDRPTSMRNIVAGLVCRKENLDLNRYLSFCAFDYINDKSKLKTEHEKLKLIDSQGFDTLDVELHDLTRDTAISKVQDTILDAKKFMSEGSFNIDGLVFVLNDLIYHKSLGVTAHHPRYKMAFKFQGESKNTIIENIDWQVSRNGVLTPVAVVTPVELAGAQISKVTLHNYGMVAQYQLKIGDEIEIIRSGEVIPKFLSVVQSAADVNFKIPGKCPACGNDVAVHDIRILCLNDNCIGKIKESILYFVQRIGINDLSHRRLSEMIAKGFVEKIPDLYHLKREELLTLDKTRDKLADKLIDGINRSLDTDLITFLSALGLSGGAYNKCEKIVMFGIDTIDKIKGLDVETLVQVESFAYKSAADFISSLETKLSLLEELIECGFVFKEITEGKKIRDSELTGKKICITGVLSEKRSIVEKKIKMLGGIIVGSVSKNTEYLLTNEQNSNSSKFKKAVDLSVKIVDEEWLDKLGKNKE